MTEKTEVETTTPHVYVALAKILAALSVEKGGTLPSNMGGKPYITAADVSLEVKRQFVENDLIYLPNESVIWHEYITANNRLQVGLGITGEYTIVSTVDGSNVQVSGTGDGLATGTAVASNIASTNALKNALLRTFLITEQSVEDAAKQGVEGGAEAAGPSPAARAVTKAKTAGATKVAAPTSNAGLKDAQAAVKDAWREVYGELPDFNEQGYMELGKSKFNSGWATRVKDLTELADAIRKGEVV